MDLLLFLYNRCDNRWLLTNQQKKCTFSSMKKHVVPIVHSAMGSGLSLMNFGMEHYPENLHNNW